MLTYRQHHFSTDLRGRREQEIKRAADRPFRGVLYGHHGVADRSGLRLPERFVDRAARDHLCGRAEMLEGGFLAESAGRTEIGDRQRLLQSATRRHDFGVQTRKCRVREGAAVDLEYPPQHLRLALGFVDRT